MHRRRYFVGTPVLPCRPITSGWWASSSSGWRAGAVFGGGLPCGRALASACKVRMMSDYFVDYIILSDHKTCSFCRTWDSQLFYFLLSISQVIHHPQGRDRTTNLLQLWTKRYSQWRSKYVKITACTVFRENSRKASTMDFLADTIPSRPSAQRPLLPLIRSS